MISPEIHSKYVKKKQFEVETVFIQKMEAETCRNS